MWVDLLSNRDSDADTSVRVPVWVEALRDRKLAGWKPPHRQKRPRRIGARAGERPLVVEDRPALATSPMDSIRFRSRRAPVRGGALARGAFELPAMTAGFIALLPRHSPAASYSFGAAKASGRPLAESFRPSMGHFGCLASSVQDPGSKVSVLFLQVDLQGAGCPFHERALPSPS